MRPQSRLTALARISLAVSVTVLATAACQQAPLTGSMPSAPAAAQAGTAQISVVPQWGRKVAAVGPYGIGDVAHMRVEVWTLSEGIATTVAAATDLQRGELTGPYLFTGLKSNTTYRVKAIAYKADGTAASDIISLPEFSYIDVPVTNDDAPAIANLAVRLLDTTRPMVSTFSGGSDTAPNGGGYTNGSALDSRFSGPMSFSLDVNGDVLVADWYNQKVRKVDAMTGETTTFIGNDFGYAYVDGAAADARFGHIYGVAQTPDGSTTYISDESCRCIRAVDEDGTVTSVTGTANGGDSYGNTDGPVANAKFYHPRDLTLQGNNLYVRDYSLRKIDLTTGTVSTLPYGDSSIAFDASGNMYVGNSSNVQVVDPAGNARNLLPGYNGYGDGTGDQAKLGQVSGLSLDPAGNVYLADSANRAIRRIDAAGNLTTLAGGNSVEINEPGFLNGAGAIARFTNPAAIIFVPRVNKLLVKDDSNAIRSVQ